jgi:hypothetical protein
MTQSFEMLPPDQALRAWAFKECAHLGALGGWRFPEMITAAAELVDYVKSGSVPQDAKASPSQSQFQSLSADRFESLERRQPCLKGQEVGLGSLQSNSSPVVGLDTATEAETGGGVNVSTGEG